MTLRRTQDIFPTPIYVRDLEGEQLAQANREISERMTTILAASTPVPAVPNFATTWNPKRNDDIQNYNLEGLMLAIIDAGVDYLGDIGYQGRDLRLQHSWLNWAGHQSYMFDHDYPQAKLCGTYYYQTSGTDGDRVFANPVPPAALGLWPYDWDIVPKYSVQPQVGRLVLWPAWLKNRIEVNLQQTEQITVNFTLI